MKCTVSKWTIHLSNGLRELPSRSQMTTFWHRVNCGSFQTSTYQCTATFSFSYTLHEAKPIRLFGFFGVLGLPVLIQSCLYFSNKEGAVPPPSELCFWWHSIGDLANLIRCGIDSCPLVDLDILGSRWSVSLHLCNFLDLFLLPMTSISVLLPSSLMFLGRIPGLSTSSISIKRDGYPRVLRCQTWPKRLTTNLESWKR